MSRATPSTRATPAPRNARLSRLSLVPDTPGGRSTISTATSNTASGRFPEYEPPAFSLTPAAQEQLRQLARGNASLAKLEKSLTNAQDALAQCAGEINDRVYHRLDREERLKRKRRQQDGDEEGAADDEEGAADQSSAELQDKVERMTARMEEGMRKTVDGRHHVQSIKDSLATTHTIAQANATQQASTQHTRSTQRRRRERNDSDSELEDDDEEEELPEPPTPTDPEGPTQAPTIPLDVFKQRLDDARTRYQSFSLAARYAEDEQYVNFKRIVHDSRYPNGETTAPHARTWFPEEGDVPAPGVTRAGTRGRAANEEEDDSDDDIAIERATISTKCPLTLQEFRNPLTSRKCSHSFEGSAISELLRGKRDGVQCPVGGCRETLTKADLHTDPVLLRKIKRLQRAKELEAEEDEDDEQEGGDGRTQRNAAVIDSDALDGGEEEDVDRVIARQTQKLMKVEPRGSGSGVGMGRAPPMQSTQPVDLGDSSDEEE